MIAAADLRADVADLHAAYAACLDDGRFDDWPDFFTDDCVYRVVPRENFERGFPLAIMDLSGTGMLRDRVYGVSSTLFHAPYYQRHIIGPTRIVARDGDMLECRTNYLVVRTKRDLPSEIFNAGEYRDRIAVTGAGLRFVEKLCIFDSELIPNSIIYPI